MLETIDGKFLNDDMKMNSDAEKKLIEYSSYILTRKDHYNS